MNTALPVMLSLLALLGLSGCYSHVRLDPVPEKEAPLEERVAAYKELQPVAQRNTVTLHRGGFGAGFVTSNTDFLVLGNGLRVHHPEDLLPAVDFNSPTAQYIREYEAWKKREMTSAWVGYGAMGVAGAALLASLPFESSDGRAQALYWTAGTAGAVLMGSLAVSLTSTFLSRRERDSAFMTYDRSLQKRLGLDSEAEEDAPRPEQATTEL